MFDCLLTHQSLILLIVTVFHSVQREREMSWCCGVCGRNMLVCGSATAQEVVVMARQHQNPVHHLHFLCLPFLCSVS